MRHDRFLLEVRPFGNKCSFDCSHCYQSRSSSEPVLDPECIAAVLELIALHYRAVRIVFHGGEPLSDGGNWIVDAIRKVEKASQHIEISYLVHSSGWIMPLKLDFLSSREVLFGLSIVPNVNVSVSKSLPPLVGVACDAGLCAGIQIVLTKSVLTTAQDIRKAIALLPRGMNVKFIPCMGIGPASAHGISGEEYGKALLTIKEIAEEDSLWNKHFLEPLTWCRNFRRPLEVFQGCRFEPKKCSLQKGEVVSLAIDSDGTFYPCNRFAALKVLPVASIKSINWLSEAEAHLGQYRTQLAEVVSTRTHCDECLAYRKRLCSGAGGCPFHKCFLGSISSPRDPFCLGEQMLLDQFMREAHDGD